MSGDQVTFVAAAFVILIAITLAAQFKWLPEGRVKFILVLISGVAVILALRLAQLPPSWFSGSAASFGLALSLSAGAFLGRSADERSFGLPLLLGMGGSLLVLNIIELISKRL